MVKLVDTQETLSAKLWSFRATSSALVRRNWYSSFRESKLERHQQTNDSNDGCGSSIMLLCSMAFKKFEARPSLAASNAKCSRGHLSCPPWTKATCKLLSFNCLATAWLLLQDERIRQANGSSKKHVWKPCFIFITWWPVQQILKMSCQSLSLLASFGVMNGSETSTGIL